MSAWFQFAFGTFMLSASAFIWVMIVVAIQEIRNG